MKEFDLKRITGYKKLSNPECGRTKQTHIGLSDGFFKFLTKSNKFTISSKSCKFYYQDKVVKSSCTINAIKPKGSSKHRNPKLTSGELEKGTIFKLIKNIAETNSNQYYLVWNFSDNLGDFLLIEKNKNNYDLIEKLEDKSVFDETKVWLITAKFAEIDKANAKKNTIKEETVIIKDDNFRQFAFNVFKYINKKFKDEFLTSYSKTTKTKVGKIEYQGIVFPKYFGTAKLMGVFKTNSDADIAKKTKKPKFRYNQEDLKILDKNNIYFSTEFEIPKKNKSHINFKAYKKFIEDYSRDKYSIRHDEKSNLCSFYLNTEFKHFEQKIYFGSPGTGKSRLIKNRIGNGWPRITFHPELDYQGFVGAYKPTMKPISDTDTKEEISYEYVPEAFIKAYCKAWKSNSPHYLIIEEINRGNCAQIFGDIFQLLDRDDEGYSEYPIECSPDIRKFLKKEFDKDFGRTSEYEKVTGSTDYSKMVLPNNLSILATMNTSDQSLFPMDSAFKRRWDWQYVPIDYDDATNNLTIEVGDVYNWGDFILKINTEIKELTQSEDKQIGNRFVSPGNGKISKEQFVSKVLFYLWAEIYKDEQGTGNTIFINSSNDNELTFGDFFKTDGKVNEDVLIRFLEDTTPKKKEETDVNQVTDNTEG